MPLPQLIASFSNHCALSRGRPGPRRRNDLAHKHFATMQFNVAVSVSSPEPPSCQEGCARFRVSDSGPLAGETNVRMRIPRITALGRGPPNPKTHKGLLDWGVAVRCRRKAPHRKTFEVKLSTERNPETLDLISPKLCCVRVKYSTLISQGGVSQGKVKSFLQRLSLPHPLYILRWERKEPLFCGLVYVASGKMKKKTC